MAFIVAIMSFEPFMMCEAITVFIRFLSFLKLNMSPMVMVIVLPQHFFHNLCGFIAKFLYSIVIWGNVCNSIAELIVYTYIHHLTPPYPYRNHM